MDCGVQFEEVLSLGCRKSPLFLARALHPVESTCGGGEAGVCTVSIDRPDLKRQFEW